MVKRELYTRRIDIRDIVTTQTGPDSIATIIITAAGSLYRNVLRNFMPTIRRRATGHKEWAKYVENRSLPDHQDWTEKEIHRLTDNCSVTMGDACREREIVDKGNNNRHGLLRTSCDNIPFGPTSNLI